MVYKILKLQNSGESAQATEVLLKAMKTDTK